MFKYFGFLLLLVSHSAFSAVNLAKVQCRFADPNGLKLTLNFTKQKTFHGYSMLNPSWGAASQPIRKISHVKVGKNKADYQPYKAQIKTRTGQGLPSKDVPVALIKVHRDQDKLKGIIEAYVPNESILRANNPRIAKSYVITTASLVFNNGAATSLKGVCWK